MSYSRSTGSKGEKFEVCFSYQLVSLEFGFILKHEDAIVIWNFQANNSGRS